MSEKEREAEKMARNLKGKKRFRVDISATGSVRVTAESVNEAVKKARINYDWARIINNFEVVDVDEVDEI